MYESFTRNRAVGLIGSELRENATRTDYRIEKPARRKSVAEIQAVAQNSPDSQMICDRTHDVVETLTRENDVVTSGHCLLQFFDAARFQSGFKEIVKKLFSKKIQPVATLTPQHGVEKAGSEDAIRGIEKWAAHSQHSHRSATSPALQETLGVPS